MAEQTMVALLWQGDARGTLNLPASTKVEDLKLRLNSAWLGLDPTCYEYTRM